MTIHKCVQCGTTNPLDFYNRMKSNCKSCHNKGRSQYTKSTKELAVEYKGGKCECCGYNTYIGALEFHHVDPSLKDPDYKNKKNGSFDNFKSELDKCILVCANCHREIHANIRTMHP